MVQCESVDAAQKKGANTVPDGQQRLRLHTFLLDPPSSTDGLGNKQRNAKLGSENGIQNVTG